MFAGYSTLRLCEPMNHVMSRRYYIVLVCVGSLCLLVMVVLGVAP